jgi:hypothetical protein
MLEKDANRRYRLEMGASLAIYIAVLHTSISYARPMPPGTLRTVLLLVPVIPALLGVWAVARHFRRMDEFVRLRSLESLGFAGAVTAVLAVTYGFLETAGFPKLSMFWVWMVIGLTWGFATLLRSLGRR